MILKMSLECDKGFLKIVLSVPSPVLRRFLAVPRAELCSVASSEGKMLNSIVLRRISAPSRRHCLAGRYVVRSFVVTGADWSVGT